MRLPAVVGFVTVTLSATAPASAGTPHWPAIAKARAAPAASAGPPHGPVAFRVSTMRHGARVWNWSGPPVGFQPPIRAMSHQSALATRTAPAPFRCPPSLVHSGRMSSRPLESVSFTPAASWHSMSAMSKRSLPFATAYALTWSLNACRAVLPDVSIGIVHQTKRFVG